MQASTNIPAAEFSHVTMDFPGIRANDDISFSVEPGEIFALVGENGAGRSTLMNILFGILTPTAGEVRIKGVPVTKFSPKNALAAGVGMVHQHFMLVPSFTVAQNILLSREPKKLGFLYDQAAGDRIVRQLSRDYGLAVEPTDIIRDLSVGIQQRVEILKTLYRGAELLILDEPTAVLTPQETDELFAVLRRMAREKNMTILIITHKLYEVMAISDRVGVMRQGKLVGVHQTRDVTQRQLAAMMVGKELPQLQHRAGVENGPVRIQVEDLRATDDRGLPILKGVSFQVRAGEILGIAAVEGNGQSQLLEAVTGLRPYAGSVTIDGQDIRGMDPGQIRELGLAHVPEDRLATGVSRDATITENLITGKERKLSKWGIHLDKKTTGAYAQKLFEQFDIRAADLQVPAGSLSGGNMQKVVIAREFSFDSKVLVIAQPTRGVDIGAIQFIHQRILQKKEEGAAILLCSADLDEVLQLSDRVITICDGKITGTFLSGDFSKEEIGLHMTGQGKEAAHEA